MSDKELLQLSLKHDEDFRQWYEASVAYYDIEQEDLMPDEEFDELTELLKEKYNTTNSVEEDFILSIISYGIQQADGSIKIIEPSENINTSQISLKKIKYSDSKTIGETKKFLSEGSYKTNLTALYISPKLDGISLKIVFETETTPLLIQTRGGQDVTNELMNNHDIVALISDHNKGRITSNILHGELVIDKKVFLKKYSDTYENARNCIVGVLKTNANDLRFLVCTDGFQPGNINFNVWQPLTPGLNLEVYFKANYKNDIYPFQVDGMVIGHKLVSMSDFQVKGNYPLNMVAIKFKAESVQTEVIDIEWSIKKSGKLTPVLHVKPVLLDGTTIGRASAYSYYTLKSKKIGIGSQITIHKSGDIIPTVDRVLSRSTNWNLPEIDFREEGKHIFTLENTVEQKIQKFTLGLKLLQLDGIGPVISEKIGKVFDYDIIKLFDSTYRADIKILLGSDSANWSRFDQFYTIKTIPLDQLIEMLQLNNCGKTLSKKFAEIMTGKQIDTKGINKLLLNDTCRSGGVNNNIIKESMNRMKEFGIKIIKPIEISENSIIFEMTGNPPGMTKQEFMNKLRVINPNAIHSSLTKNTSVLFVDDLNSNTSKINKARKYNVKIMLYSEGLKHTF